MSSEMRPVAVAEAGREWQTANPLSPRRAVIPAKAGIQKGGACGQRNQARIASDKSHLPANSVIPAKAGIQKGATNLATGTQARIASDKSPLLMGL